MDVIKIRSVFLWHNMHQYQLHGSHTKRRAGILTGNRKEKEINPENVIHSKIPCEQTFQLLKSEDKKNNDDLKGSGLYWYKTKILLLIC